MKKIILCFLILFSLLSLISCTSDDGAPSLKQEITDTMQQIVGTKKDPTVKFVTNGGSYIKPQETKVISSVPRTQKENCLFDGWYLDEDFTSIAVFPLTVDTDTTLYAKWINLYDTGRCTGGSIKLATDHDCMITWYVTPSTFDLEKLAAKGYRMRITVHYDVYYRKDYDVLWDIGYAGAPKYEAFLLNSDGLGCVEENLTTSTTASSRSLVYTSSIADLKTQRLKLSFSTNNIQNIIYFDNISIVYECYK